MAARRTVGWNESIPLADGAYERTCRWCGEGFRASRRDAQLCSAKCRTSASRHDALQADAASDAAASRCTTCGAMIGDARRGARFCTDSCRQRMVRRRRSEHGWLELTGAGRGFRVCAGPACSTVFVIASRAGRPRVYCSTRCRVARHRADAASNGASS